MGAPSVSCYTLYDLSARQAHTLAKWLSCNGEAWGMGPTAVFASAAALFLYNELRATIHTGGVQVQSTLLENTLISTMMLGMLALMVHLWVCSMRFFLYYLDTLIRDSPSVLLEMTTVGLLGGEVELVPLGPLTRFLRQQQPQIHITICWFLSLCYADYVRKNYSQRFNLPYLEQWQEEIQERAAMGVNKTIKKFQNVVAAVQERIRGHELPPQPSAVAQTDSMLSRRPASSVDIRELANRITSQSRTVGGGRASDTDLVRKKPAHHTVSFLVKTGDTTAEAIEKLKNFISATRCSCMNSKQTHPFEDATVQDLIR
ncbi:uncharacterized protein [Battus philenor]|uniref:uncharacterized protein n=1 Tax=Battus philenor TaxID=42288 RepID=UPI0035CE9127